MRLCVAVASLTLAVGCSETAPDETAAGGAGGQAPVVGCAPGEVPLEDGGCRAPGVPPEGCGEGFVHDGNGACNAVVPDGPCAPGSMATVGETACREVAPCGAAPWGDVAIEAGAQFVDASFTGVSTGAESAPWTTIQEAIDAASGMVVIAEGDYDESLSIITPVKLWGRCPSLVTVRGNGVDHPIRVAGTAGAEIHTLAVTGTGVGLLATYSEGLIVDRIRVHDTTDAGISLQVGSASVEGVLVEKATYAGLVTYGADVAITGSLLRNVIPGGSIGRGEALSINNSGVDRSVVSVSRSVVEGGVGTGVFVVASDAHLDSTLVRDTLPIAAGNFGFGALVNDVDGDPANATILRSVFERNTTLGIFVGASTLALENTTIRDTKPAQVPDPSDFTFGIGITGQDDLMTGQRSHLTLTSSTIERNECAGLQLVGSDAILEATLVRDIRAQTSDGLLGRGINAQPNPGTGQLPTLALRHSAVTRVVEVGIAVAGATDLRLEATAVTDVEPQPANATLGRGITIQDDAATGARTLASVLDVAVERTHEGGLFVISSDATIDRLRVADTAASVSDGSFGDGIVVMSFASIANATVSNATVFGSGRAGVSNFGANVGIGTTTSECNFLHLDGELYQGAKPFTFEDHGGNRCGCEDAFDPCKVVSSNLVPPDPVDGGPGS